MSQDTNVVPFSLAARLCNNSQDIAEQLRALAQEIEDGDWGNVRIATTVMDTDSGVLRVTLGPPGTCVIEVVGLLNWAAHKAIDVQ